MTTTKETMKIIAMGLGETGAREPDAMITINALTAADKVIIPVQAQYL